MTVSTSLDGFLYAILDPPSLLMTGFLVVVGFNFFPSNLCTQTCFDAQQNKTKQTKHTTRNIKISLNSDILFGHNGDERQ